MQIPLKWNKQVESRREVSITSAHFLQSHLATCVRALEGGGSSTNVLLTIKEACGLGLMVITVPTRGDLSCTLPRQDLVLGMLWASVVQTEPPGRWLRNTCGTRPSSSTWREERGRLPQETHQDQNLTSKSPPRL